MERKDEIALKIATMGPNAFKNSSMVLLISLENKYPSNYSVKRHIARYLTNSGDFNEAAVRLLFLCIKQKKLEDVIHLMCISFYTGDHRFYFVRMRMLTLLEEPDKSFISEVYSVLQQHRFKLRFNHFLERKRKTYTATTVNSPNEYQYHHFHVNAKTAIDKKNVKNGLEFIRDAFRTSSYSETIQYLIEYKKISLLHKLKSANHFFKKYYRMVSRDIHAGLINVLEAILLTRSKKHLRQFMKMLKHSRKKCKINPFLSYTKDDSCRPSTHLEY